MGAGKRKVVEGRRIEEERWNVKRVFGSMGRRINEMERTSCEEDA